MTLAETEAELGSFFAATHQWKLAREWSEAAVKDDPKLALAHEEMGFVDFQTGKDDEAVREFSQALDLDPKMYRCLFARTMLSPLPHSTIPADQQAYRMALLKVVEGNPQFAPAYVELAKLYVGQGDPVKALGLALKAEKLEPWRAGYHLLTGQILLRVNRAPEAASYAVYVADHWSEPDHGEALELWNLVPAEKRPVQGPEQITSGTDGSVEGIVKSVACTEHGMTISLEKDGQNLASAFKMPMVDFLTLCGLAKTTSLLVVTQQVFAQSCGTSLRATSHMRGTL